MSSDTNRFEEAVAWFRRRVPISEAAYARLETRLKDYAFKVAGGTSESLVLDVWKAVDKAIAKGESLEQFRGRVQKKLEKEWKGTVSNPAARVDTIFRTNVQSAYGAGRYEQMTQPDVLETRPYWRLVVIEDKRTSPICRTLVGIVLPALHPFWKTHWPPLHFNCRSAVRALSEGQARRAGIAKKTPRIAADTGFGRVIESYSLPPSVTPLPPELAKAIKRRR